MAQMPTNLQLEQATAGRGVAVITKNTARDLMLEEQRGRLTRDSQVQDNCRVDAWIQATFAAEDNGVKVTDWIDFAQIHFTEKPAFTSGSQRVAQEGEEVLAPDASNFDPGEHFTVPGVAMVAAWRQDGRGFYTGAKVFLFALASVPDGYKTNISAVWMGPAVRVGE